MTARALRVPDPDHPITIEPHRGRVVVRHGDTVLADTRDAIVLFEAGYRPVFYLPPADVDMTQLTRSDHASYCPYKGDASYYHVPLLGAGSANAVWCYEAPYDAVAAIAGRLAFYRDRVEIVAEAGDAR